LITLGLIVVAVLIALALWWRHAEKQKNFRAATVRDIERPSENYHCVELRYRGDACDAVKKFGGKRFLPGEAPGIPVPGCDSTKCSCRYVHHEDRRHDDRRNPFAQQADPPPAEAGGDRRSKKDRRKPPKTPFKPKTGQ
jgi:FtsZ-interacting cell division protein ZipA